MAQHVEVNGHILEFPDGMSDAEMAKAIQANGAQFSKAPATPAGNAIAQAAGKGLYGLVKGAADPVYGLSQLALHGVNSLYQGLKGNTLSSLVSGKNSNPMQQLTDEYDNFLRNQEATYQNDTAGSVAAGTGRFIANIAPAIASLGATAPAAAATAAPAATSALATALANSPRLAATLAAVSKGPLSGGVVSSTMPIDDVGNNDYWGKKALQAGAGAVVGGIIPAGIGAGKGLVNAVRPAINPRGAVADNLARAVQADAGLAGSAASPAQDPVITQMLNAGNVQSLTGARSANEVLARILNRPRYVAGSNPTTAQVVNTPQLSMAEKALMNDPAYLEAISQRGNENNAARIAQLGMIAKTPEELAAAIDARKAATGPLYESAFSQDYPIDAELQSILARPSAKAALVQGANAAAERNTTLGMTEAVPAQQAAAKLPDASGLWGVPATTQVAGAQGSVPGQTLQYLKMGIQGVIPQDRPGGIQGLTSDAIKQTQKDLHGWLLKNAPDYAAADKLYAQHSAPINDMRVGQAARDALGLTTPAGELATSVDQLGARKALNSNGDTALTLNNYQAAIRKALGEEGDYGMTPEAARMTDSIAADLQRQSSGAAAVPKVGSDTAYNLQAPNWLAGKLFGPDLSGASNAGPAIAGGATFLADLLGGGGVLSSAGAAGPVAYGMKKGGEFVGNRVNQQLQQSMLDPDYFAQLLREGLARGLQQQGSGLSVPAASAAGGVTGSLFGN